MLRVEAASLDYALTHVIARGDTDVLPPAPEFNAIFHDWNAVKTSLTELDLDTWANRPLRTCLSPKRSLGFRIATQLDPFDTLLFTAVVYEAGSDIEARRVATTAGIVHSHRFAPQESGQLYDPAFNWDSFRRRSLELAAGHGGLVVATDIADFFPRIYHHPLENALQVACSSKGHARVIAKFLKGFNQGVSHGIPVGPAAVRLLSELAIDDVDRALLGEGYNFCRYSDDYRIFVSSEREARRALAFLANTLFRHHGLTLQESKTAFMAAEEFVGRFSRADEDAERASLEEKFDAIVAELQRKELQRLNERGELTAGWPEFEFLQFSNYADVSFTDLSEEQQEVVNSLNLWNLLSDQIRASASLDSSLTRFLLRRIADLKLKGDYELLLASMARLYSLFPAVLEAIASHGFGSEESKMAIGSRLLDLLDDQVVGHLEYHRVWIFSVFASDRSWNHAARMQQLYNVYADGLTRTQLTYALGEAGVDHWFRGHKQDMLGLPIWERRAFLAGARCLPKDEAQYWFSSVSAQLDSLERVIVKWARTFLA